MSAAKRAVQPAVDQDTSDREIVISRLINAPRELVWEAYSDPKHITHWWGPRGFSTTTKSMDMRPGGEWRFVMHGPDGTDYKNLVRYIEVVRLERLVFDHSGEDETAHIKFVSHVTFEPQGDKTLVTLRVVCASKAERDKIEAFSGATEGGRQTLARLDEHVAAMARDRAGTGERPFVISRTFKAPRELVWRVWTEAEHLKHWWGPKGCKIEIKTLDVRPGGVFHYRFTYATGAAMWGRFSYIEVVPTERLVFRNAFSDAAGGLTRAPFNATFPLEVENTVLFSEHKGLTTVSLRGLPHDATAEERATYEGFFASMEQGFGGSFEVLGAYLAKLQGQA